MIFWDKSEMYEKKRNRDAPFAVIAFLSPPHIYPLILLLLFSHILLSSTSTRVITIIKLW